MNCLVPQLGNGVTVTKQTGRQLDNSTGHTQVRHDWFRSTARTKVKPGERVAGFTVEVYPKIVVLCAQTHAFSSCARMKAPCCRLTTPQASMVDPWVPDLQYSYMAFLFSVEMQTECPTISSCHRVATFTVEVYPRIVVLWAQKQACLEVSAPQLQAREYLGEGRSLLICKPLNPFTLLDSSMCHYNSDSRNFVGGDQDLNSGSLDDKSMH